VIRFALALTGLLLLAEPVLAQDEMPKEAGQEAKPGATAPGGPAPAAPAEEQEPSAPPPGTMVDQPVAILQALDKITARVRRLPIKVGQSAPFGTLTVEVNACRKAPPEDPPESAAFLKITDTEPGEAPKVVFSGWMFASSPALSAMDHPVYDISVVDCTSDASAAETPAQ